MSWACPCRLTSAPLYQEPATPRSNCGTSGTACADRPSQATSRTSTPSVWVCWGRVSGLVCKLQVVKYECSFILSLYLVLQAIWMRNFNNLYACSVHSSWELINEQKQLYNVCWSSDVIRVVSAWRLQIYDEQLTLQSVVRCLKDMCIYSPMQGAAHQRCCIIRVALWEM